MTAVEKDGAIEAVRRVIAGDYTAEERMMLSVTVKRAGKIILESDAINDGVLSRRERVLSLDEYFGGEKVYSFTGDGVIIATPDRVDSLFAFGRRAVAPPI